MQPPPGLAVNVAVESVACEDAPMRVVPGTHMHLYNMSAMRLEDEADYLYARGFDTVTALGMETAIAAADP